MATPSGNAAAGSTPLPTVTPLPPLPGGPAPSRGPNKRLLGIVALVLLVVMFVLALSTAGVISVFGTTASSSSTQTFNQARGTAQAAANGVPGGPWTLEFSGGIASPNPRAANTSDYANLTSLASGSVKCTVTLADGLPDQITPDGVANISTGGASAWIFAFVNATDAFELTLVNGGSATNVAVVTGCATPVSPVAAIPANVIDSSAAATIADENGGYAFLQEHPGANATYVVFGGISLFGVTTGPLWNVDYETCPLSLGSGTNSTGSSFSASVDAESGSLLHAGSSSVTCSGAVLP